MIAPAHSLKVYRLEIVLRGSKPRIWRRFLVPGAFTLARLHKVIQVVMGWQNCHLHEFIINGRHYGEPDPDYDSCEMEMMNHRKFKLEQLAPMEGASFEYVYDFGDGWRHDLTVEAILPADPSRPCPVCLAGGQACPIEDSGALPGYYQKLTILRDPGHPEREEIKAWMPRGFDPSRFDLKQVNRRLAKLTKR